MAARKLDGVACAARLREDVAPRIAAFQQRYGRPPGLAVVLAGQNPASEVYVRNKIKTVSEAGCRAQLLRLDQSASADEALALVRKLNADDATLGHSGGHFVGQDSQAAAYFQHTGIRPQLQEFQKRRVGQPVEGRQTPLFVGLSAVNVAGLGHGRVETSVV